MGSSQEVSDDAVNASKKFRKRHQFAGVKDNKFYPALTCIDGTNSVGSAKKGNK
jgi:hypothetical protein